jgi:2,4-dienoyl-CoA reductase (NADPH2)
VAPNLAGSEFSLKSSFFKNILGRVSLGAGMMSSKRDADKHRPVTQAVHDHGGLIAMQILHSGRYVDIYLKLIALPNCSYAYHFNPVSASAVKSPISWYKPKVRLTVTASFQLFKSEL